ncbi:MAG TPA: DUF4301 family protein [Prolixibacteraceae bacterium]|nr:DUF4301 family protein [Bacteroidales bacterium]HQN93497.1 DUF4301 family protein [Prolixibacteraceae bacterium]
MLAEKDIKQIETQGLTLEEFEKQIQHFQKGFASIKLIGPATPENGIKILSEEDITRMISVFENSLSSGLLALKFVPASGAASRMFKDLYSFLEKAANTEDAEQLADNDSFVKTFFTNIEKFAFYNSLSKITVNQDDKTEWVKKLLMPDGLGYGQKPKGQLAFHKYGDSFRTPFEEHLVEAASYCTGTNGMAQVHFTVSPEHQDGFEQLLKKVRNEYQKRYGVQLKVTFSHQHKSTDTVAVDKNNEPFRNSDGSMVFRPGGHGALLENLNELDSDIVFIKNIDNVVPDHLKAETKRFKKVLAGLLVSERNKIYTYLEKLDKPEAAENNDLLKTIEAFLRKELFIQFDNDFASNEDKIVFFKKKLNRPLRVCGMVKNQGEPGGGPFIVVNGDGTISPQILESAQINLADEKQAELFSQSTHFNPVDLVCSIKDYKGKKFDLLAFRDPETGFISTKSQNGQEFKALELPGLWNGAMADWNTIFVEVPAITFNPVKTVNDLLRPEHQ